MRRFVSAAVAVLLASGLVFVAAPAHAIEVPPPPPVAPSPYTSSTLSRTSSSPFTGGPLTPQQQAERNVRYSLLQGHNTAGAVDTPDKVAQPVGPPKLLSRVAGGAGILGASVLVVPMAVEGGIRMLAVSSEVGGAEYEDIICGSVGTTDGFTEWLYGDYDCRPPVADPNPDVTAGMQISYAGTTIIFRKVLYNGGQYTMYCGTPNAPPAGVNHVAIIHPTGTQGVSYSNQSSVADATCGMPGTAVYNYIERVAPTYVLHFEFRRTTDNVVVATSVETSDDPERAASCDVEWSDGTVTSGVPSLYRESEGFPLSDVDCDVDAGPAGATPVGVSIQSDNGGVKTELADFPVPADLQAPQPAKGLRLEKVEDGTTLSCMTWEADCVGWWAATNEGTLTTSPYRCLFGDAEIALSECGLYRFTFDEETATPTLSDPVTGEEIPWRSTDDEGNSTNPGTGPTPGEDCLQSWPSIADPIWWVLHPVKCALVWAFVPRTSEVTRLTGELTSMWEDTGVGLTVNTITAWEFTAPTSGCHGVLVPMSTIFEHGVEDFSLLNACAGSPLQQTAVWSYWIILIASVINLLSSITRNIGSIVGARGVAQGDDE